MFNWQDFLEKHSIDFDPSQQLEQGLFLLDDYGVILVKGPDATTFLQGQCTCDFDKLDQNNFTFGAHCNAKGRMNSNFLAVVIDDNTIGLRTHRSNIDFALAALKKYSIFSKVELSIADELAIIGSIGSEAIEKIQQSGYSLPEANQVLTQNSSTFIAHDADRIEGWVNQQDLAKIIDQFDQKQLTIHTNTWRAANIRAGIADITLATQEKLIPQEISLDRLDGVSFNKGCYTGQEVIARLHHKGALKKHLQLCQITTPAAPNILEKLTLEGKNCGQIIDMEQINEDGYVLLVQIDDSAFEQPEVELAQNSSAKLQWLPLSYAIP